MTALEAIIEKMQKAGAPAEAMAAILFESAISSKSASELYYQREAALLAISAELSQWLYDNPKFPGFVAW